MLSNDNQDPNSFNLYLLNAQNKSFIFEWIYKEKQKICPIAKLNAGALGRWINETLQIKLS